MDRTIFLERLVEIIPDTEIIEDLPDHPKLKFELSNKEFLVYSAENYIRRTKFCREFHTYFEISPIDASEIEVLKKNGFELFTCKNCILGDRIIFNISSVAKHDGVLMFIENYKNDPVLN